MMPFKSLIKFLFITTLIFLTASCSSKKISNVNYTSNKNKYNIETDLSLNIFIPENSSTNLNTIATTKDFSASVNSINNKNTSILKDSIITKDSINYSNTTNLKDSITQKKSITLTDSIALKDSIAVNNSVNEKKIITSNDSIIHTGEIILKDLVTLNDSINQKRTITVKDSVSTNVSVTQQGSINTKTPVLVFVHGGNWHSGNKNMYSFIGRNFAKKNVLTIIPSYTLSPKGNYKTMVQDITNAINWTYENCSKYNGDPSKIYLMGHSAGGHLIALSTTNPKYLKDKSKVRGVILDDAAGLDMLTQFINRQPTTKSNYIKTWTQKPANWKDASPKYYVDAKTPEFLIYVGKKTHPSIKTQNKAFIETLKGYQPNVKPIYLDKNHVGMITQFMSGKSERYDEILKFMN